MPDAEIADFIRAAGYGEFLSDTVVTFSGRNQNVAGTTTTGIDVFARRIRATGQARAGLRRAERFERLGGELPLRHLRWPTPLASDATRGIHVTRWLKDCRTAADAVADGIFGPELARSLGRALGELHSLRVSSEIASVVRNAASRAIANAEPPHPRRLVDESVSGSCFSPTGRSSGRATRPGTSARWSARRRLDEVLPTLVAFAEGYRSVRSAPDDGLAVRAVAFAGWHLFERVMAAAAFRSDLSPVHRAAAGVGRTALVTPAASSPYSGWGPYDPRTDRDHRGGHRTGARPQRVRRGRRDPCGRQRHSTRNRGHRHAPRPARRARQAGSRCGAWAKGPTSRGP